MLNFRFGWPHKIYAIDTQGQGQQRTLARKSVSFTVIETPVGSSKQYVSFTQQADYEAPCWQVGDMLEDASPSEQAPEENRHARVSLHCTRPYTAEADHPQSHCPLLGES